MEIIPAIIAKSFEELREKIKLVDPYVSWVQLDIMDGKFVKEKSWPYVDNGMGIIGNLPEKLETELDIEVHLMVEDVEAEVERWLGSGVKRILAHWETIEKSKIKNQKLKIQKLIEKCRQHNIEFGLALNLETTIDVLDEISFLIHNSDFVIQLMSIAKIGHHGEKFNDGVIHKAVSLRQKYPDVKISIDGGINKEAAFKMAKVGVNNFIVGSAIFNSKNIKESIKESIEELKNKY